MENEYGIASLISGILSMLLFLMPYLGLPLAILGLVFAAKQNEINKTGFSSAGNILAIIGIIINAIMLFMTILTFLFYSSLSSIGMM